MGSGVYSTGSDDPFIPYVIVTLTHSPTMQGFLEMTFVGTVFLTPRVCFPIVDTIVTADLVLYENE